MQSRFRPNKVSKDKQRKQLSLPQANIKMTTFFNQKINTFIDISKNSRSLLSQRLSHLGQQKRFSFIVTPKQQTNSGLGPMFDDSLHTKKIFRKLLKYSSMNLKENKKRNSFISNSKIQNQTKKLKQGSSKASHSILNNKKSILLDDNHHQTIRRQLQDKFSRTRMIFKQQQKLKRYDRIQKIYDKKHPAAKFIKSSKIQKNDFAQNDKCQPWFKSRIKSHQTQIYVEDEAEGFQHQID